MVEMFLEKKQLDANATDKRGETALTFAADAGNETTVNLLLEKKANVDAAKEYCFPTLFWAGRHG